MESHFFLEKKVFVPLSIDSSAHQSVRIIIAHEEKVTNNKSMTRSHIEYLLSEFNFPEDDLFRVNGGTLENVNRNNSLFELI